MILIQVDASGLTQGAEKVESASNKMTDALERTANKGNFLEHIIHHLKREFLGFTVAAIGFGAALEGIRGTMEYFNKISEASEKLQVNVELLEAWNQAVIKSGGTAESFDESITHVAKTFNTSNATIMKVLPQFADLFHRLNTQQALNYGKKIGFDTSTILLLHQGGKAVEEIIAKQKSLGLITQQQQELLKKYNAAWADTKQQLRYVTFEAELGLLPALTKVVGYLGETIGYFNKHSTFVKTFLASFAAMTLAVKIYGRATVVAAAEAEAGWTAILGPIALVSGAIALIVDDIAAWKRGDDSITGEIVKRWPAVGAVINSVISGAISLSKDLFWLWEKEFEIIGEIIDKIESSYSKIKGLFDKKYTHNFSSAYDPQLLGISNARAAIEEVNKISSYGFMHSQGALRSPVNKNISVTFGDININSNSSDPIVVANHVTRTLTDQIRQATAQHDDGITI